MTYEWNALKCRGNIRKHGVDFADAVAVFGDDALMIVEDDAPDEERFIALGLDGLGRVLVIVFAWRGDRIRIISARKANRAEQRLHKGVAP